jgi:monoamine oxidase
MTSDPNNLSRRFLPRAMTALAGAAALPPLGSNRARAAMPDLPANFGKGCSIAIVGGGVAGLTAGWKLANAGFKVTIYEANNRYGGRSLTAHPERPEYRDWRYSKYNPQKLFPEMYVSSYQEIAPSPVTQTQVCRFDDPAWNPHGGQPPVELFLNAGPGRIPGDHVALIDLCLKTGVALEPYIFQSNHNLLQSSKFRGGAPIAYNQVNYSLTGQVAELLAKQIATEQPSDHRTKMLDMLQQFGDLTKRNDFPGSTRLGSSDYPGGWRNPGKVKPVVPLDQTMDSGFVGGGNPELSPGSYMFNADNIDWQNSLMQPIGGMDRVWRRLLVQDVPAAAVRPRPGDPQGGDSRARTIAARHGGRRYVGDLVLLNHQVTAIIDDDKANKINIDYVWKDPATGKTGRGRDIAGFCFSSMAPKLLAKLETNLNADFRKALATSNKRPLSRWVGRRRPASGRAITTSTARSVGPTISSARSGTRPRTSMPAPACSREPITAAAWRRNSANGIRPRALRPRWRVARNCIRVSRTRCTPARA